MPTDKKLSFGLKFAYGVGQAGEGIFGAGLGFFLLFYYSQILGLSPGLAGSAIGIAVIVDAASDIIAGSISDRAVGRQLQPLVRRQAALALRTKAARPRARGMCRSSRADNYRDLGLATWNALDSRIQA